jgi:hypothetical protein
LLDVDHARAVERRVLVRAEHQTSGQLRASLQRAVLAVDPAAAERRRQQAETRAWVALFGDHDGTASLSGRFLPAAQAAAAWARICAMAKAMEAAGAGGGMDLLRAQVFVGLLLGTLPLIPPADGGPDDPGPDDGGPNDGGLDDGGPAGDDPDGKAWDNGVPEDSPDEDNASEDHDPVGSGRDNLEQDLVRPSGRDSVWARKTSANEPGQDLLPASAWPPLPRPGAAPSPGCARPARMSPAGSRDRRGPRGAQAPGEARTRPESRARPETRANPRTRTHREARAHPGTQPQTDAHTWSAVPCSACRGGPWPDGAPSPAN